MLFPLAKRLGGGAEIFNYENNELVSKTRRYLQEKNIDVFIRTNKAIAIYHKITQFQEPSFNQLISSRKPFGFDSKFKGYAKTKNNTVKFYANKEVNYISRDEVKTNRDWIDKYKLFVPYAIGSGDSREDLVKPILGEPNSCCSETYLVFGPFEDEQTAKNVISYIQTKFFHFMLTLKKNTQHATRNAYQLVPMQDFTQSWNDEKLYAKYGLNAEEIAVIEEMIRPMERNDVA